jgi:recombination protein RecA
LIDSISTLCEEREQNEGVGTETRGGGAKLFSQFCRTMASVVPVNGAIVCGVTHIISNTSGWGSPTMERGARAWQYQCDYKFKAESKKPWISGGRQVGLEISWLCETSKTIVPGLKASSYLRFGEGIDRAYEALELGKGVGLVRCSGNWLYLDFLKKAGMVGEAPRFNGGEKARSALLERPEWEQALYQALRGASPEEESE